MRMFSWQWFITFIVLFIVFMTYGDTHPLVAGGAFVLAIFLLGPGLIRAKSKAFKAGLGEKERDDAMRRD